MSQTPLPASTDMVRLRQIIGLINQLRNELRSINLERDEAIDTILIALLLREHVLVHGETGTGKSFLADSIFSAFTDARVFKAALTKFSTETLVFGAIDPKVLREEGDTRYRTEHGIINADFAYLDEFLDANDPVLRALLPVLNERIFIKGSQQEEADLITAIATTNGDPYKVNDTLKAVVDRFKFKIHLLPVQAEQNRVLMVQNQLDGVRAEVQTKIPLADLVFLNDLIRSHNLMGSSWLTVAYAQLMDKLRKGGFTISDRTLTQLVQIMEANALLEGRTVVIPQDLQAIRFGVCEGGNPQQLAKFEQIVAPVIEEAKQKEIAGPDDTANLALEQIARELSALGPASNGNLEALGRELTKLSLEIDQVAAQVPTTVARKRDLKSQIETKRKEVSDMIFGPSKPQAKKAPKNVR